MMSFLITWIQTSQVFLRQFAAWIHPHSFLSTLILTFEYRLPIEDNPVAPTSLLNVIFMISSTLRGGENPVKNKT